MQKPMRTLIAAFVALGTVLLMGSAPVFASNAATVRSTVALTDGTGLSRGTLYEYVLTYDTGASALTLRAGTTGSYLILAGMAFGVSSNSSWKVISNSVDIAGGAVAANTFAAVPFRCGQVLAIGTVSQGIQLQVSSAMANNLGSVFIVEATAAQLLRYLRGC